MTKVSYAFNKKTGDGFIRANGDTLMLMPIWNSQGVEHDQGELNELVERLVLCYQFCEGLTKEQLGQTHGIIIPARCEDDETEAIWSLFERLYFNIWETNEGWDQHGVSDVIKIIEDHYVGDC